MRSTFLMVALPVVAALILAQTVLAQQGSGRKAGGHGCPWAGSGWKASRQAFQRQQPQPGGRCPWKGGGWRASPEQASQTASGPVSEREAERLVKDKLEATRNPNLRLGKISDEGDHYLVEITSKNGSPVDTWRVTKETGSIESIY
ncbi:hypothetical protein [Desulfoferrobacter suflitae]|uniref:hypothetical protein n=1 Tax=Desulfoferrobacter suflitae TaxID=2865782 RepID=UPI002164B83A|nr:hypothetical protein [Desulfoferrobacter suflitae]MCK8602866.1 hypothetical protein [Desulfoferrobacter suflitae]